MLIHLTEDCDKMCKNITCKKRHRTDCKHATSCKHGPKCQFKHNEKSHETAFTQLQDLKNAVKELLEDKVKHLKEIGSLERTIAQNKSEKIEISNKLSNVSKELIILKMLLK